MEEDDCSEEDVDLIIDNGSELKSSNLDECFQIDSDRKIAAHFYSNQTHKDSISNFMSNISDY